MLEQQPQIAQEVLIRSALCLCIGEPQYPRRMHRRHGAAAVARVEHATALLVQAKAVAEYSGGGGYGIEADKLPRCKQS